MKDVICLSCKEVNIIFFESVGFKQCVNCGELIFIESEKKVKV